MASPPSRSPSPLMRSIEAFRHGTGSLVPLDWSWLAVRVMTLAISTFPLVCWAYLLASLYTWPKPPLLFLAPSRWTVLAHHFIWLPWSVVEACFSLWHAYQVKRIQGPGPKPLYSRRFLHRVFARALKSGMELPGQAGEDGVDAARVDRELRGLRKRVVANGANGHRQREAQASDDGADPEPWFQEHRLDPLDPRAVQFQQDQSRWFHLAPDGDSKGLITRRDSSRWLAWSLFSCELEELEEEHRLLHSGKVGAADQAETSLADKYHTLDDAVIELGGDNGKDSGEKVDDPDVHKVMASPREWSSTDEGTRLDFVRKARRIIEARQGFAYPLTRGGPPGPAHEIDDEGRAPGASSIITHSMRLTIDPVRVSPRPFLMYCMTQSLSTLTLLFAIHLGGFQLKTQGRLSYLIKVPRNWTPEKAADPRNKGKYRPTIFLHGLGIGLAQYHSLVQQLGASKVAETHPLMIPLQPHTSQNLFSKHFLHPLGHHEMVRCLRVAMRDLGWESVQILSHSMGTIVHSWLLKSLGEKVERSCFVDPVCVRLWIPDVAGNFVYAPPPTSVALLMRYFVGLELGTANTLCRYFDWASAIVWPEDEIPHLTDRHRTTIFLAGEDAILSCEATRRYLLEHGMKEVELDEHARRGVKRGGLVVDWKAAHGELLMKDGPGMKVIMGWLAEEDEWLEEDPTSTDAAL